MLESSNSTDKEIQRQIERFQDQYLFNLQIYTKKKKIKTRIPKLKEKHSPVRISNHFPEEMRERRKRLYDLQNSYNERQITTVIKGDKFLFPSNGSVYREKVNRPSADELLDASNDKIETKVFEGKRTEDNGNRFSSYAAEVSSVKQVNQALKKILRLHRVRSATHNVYAYIFTNSEGVTHEGSNDDREHGVGRALLREMKDNNIKNCVVVVSRCFQSKIGPADSVIYWKLV